MFVCDKTDEMLNELGSYYGGITNRAIFHRAIHELLTDRDIDVWFLFPPHTNEPATIESVRSQYNGDLGAFDDSVHTLMNESFLFQWDIQNGKPRFVRSYLFKMTMAHGLEFESSLLATALTDWFNILREGGVDRVPMSSPEYRAIPSEAILTGSNAYGSIPLNLEIPDTREVVTYDIVSEMVKNAHLIIVINCFCRSSKKLMHTRTCDHPLETCILFDKLAEDTLKWGEGRIISADEALRIVKDCRAKGLMTQISNSKEPSILCNCCACCCGVIGGYERKRYVGGKPSRFRISVDPLKCQGCGVCTGICPIHSIGMSNGKANVDDTKCVGCGLCAEHCSSGALHYTLRENADTYLPDRERLDVMFL